MWPGSLQRLAGNYAVPRPPQRMSLWPALEDMHRSSLAAITAPCNFLALDKVAAFVRERYADVIWIRLASADADPGGLLVTLLGAVAQSDAAASQEVGDAAARLARRGDWQQAYRLPGQVIGAAAAQPAVLVLEGAEHLEIGRPATLDLLVSAFLPALQGDLDVLLISFTAWNSGRLDPHGTVVGGSQLRLDLGAAALAAEALGLDLAPAALNRSIAITGGAAGALGAAFSAGAVLGPDVLTVVTAHAASGPELLQRLCRRLLTHADDATLVALAGASRLGVWHADMGTTLGHSPLLQDEPWWLELADGWRQLSPVWRAPLRSAAADTDLDPASLALLADHLAAQGVGDLAVQLYLEAGEIGCAVDTAACVAADLARAGCWEALAKLSQELACPSSAARHDVEAVEAAGHRFRRHWLRRPAIFRQRRSAKPAPHAGAMAVRAPEVPAVLAVHLLGELRAAFGDRPVETWASGRGRAVFEYLVVHRHSRVRRDRLMSVFWPESSPDAARNSLNVAIHGLRQTLRAVAGDRPVVVHHDRSYFIEPDLDVWVDVEVFEQRLKAARQHLTSGEPAEARADFEAVISLYQGEFLADDPYEQWGVVMREHLRLSYLDALDKLGQLCLAGGDHSGCVEACVKLLACDSCREDASRRLMRCYSRLGQPQLALRQYHSCVSTLRRELGLMPMPATTELFERIRRQEDV